MPKVPATATTISDRKWLTLGEAVSRLALGDPFDGNAIFRALDTSREQRHSLWAASCAEAQHSALPHWPGSYSSASIDSELRSLRAIPKPWPRSAYALETMLLEAKQSYSNGWNRLEQAAQELHRAAFAGRMQL